MAETREKITFLVTKEQKEKLIQYINISNDKGINWFYTIGYGVLWWVLYDESKKLSV